MTFTSWLRNWTSNRVARRQTQHRPASAQFRPRLEALEDRCLPSQIPLTVSSLADSGPDTLRAAILAADAGSHSDKFKIGFAVTGTIDLQTPLPDLNNGIAIQGPGASSLTVERAAGFSFSSAIITVGLAQTASISGLTIANGNVRGITNDVGTLTVANCAVVNNSAGFVHFGGGISNIDGTLTVSDCTLSGNSAASGGGGIENFHGTLTVSNTTFTGNSAGFEGGGIDNDSSVTATITGSTLAGNSSGDGGGGIASWGNATLTVTSSTLTCNSATHGGGIWNVDDATLTVASCTLSANAATYGGAIYNLGDTFSGSSVTVRDSVLTDNSATTGAGIYNGPFGTLDVRGSSFSGNTAGESGGGIYNLSTATLQQCALSGNSVGSAGGGLFNGASGALTVKDSTVLHNVALLGADICNLGALTLNDSTVGVLFS
jgi:predicted outer membrane repeat protein